MVYVNSLCLRTLMRVSLRWRLIEEKLLKCNTDEFASEICKLVLQNCNGCRIDCAQLHIVMYHSYYHSCKVLVPNLAITSVDIPFLWHSWSRLRHKVSYLHFLKTKIYLEQDEKLTKIGVYFSNFKSTLNAIPDYKRTFPGKVFVVSCRRRRRVQSFRARENFKMAKADFQKKHFEGIKCECIPLLSFHLQYFLKM